jgi:hypothetical protein
MFLHAENQQLLWQTLQKTPYFVEFTQKFAGYRDAWFRTMNEQFYTQWISQRGQIPTNARELLTINKYALQFMVADLKRLLGYSSSPHANKTDSIKEIPSYNIANERKQREDTWASSFNQYQSEYNKLLEKPLLPMRGLPSEPIGDKIQNMEELLKEQTRIREMDFKPFPEPQSIAYNLSPRKLKILDEINTFPDVERIEIDMHDATKKIVRWSNDDNATTIASNIANIQEENQNKEQI